MKINSIIALRKVLKNKKQLISVENRELVDKVLNFKNISNLSANDILTAMICTGDHVDVISPLLGIDRVLLFSLHADYDVDIDGDSVAISAKKDVKSIILKLHKKEN